MVCFSSKAYEVSSHKDGHLMVEGSGQQNIWRVWEASRDWERRDGFSYYDRQRNKLAVYADKYGVQLARVVGAFAALSPNNSETSTYIALSTCLRIASGELPATASVRAYGKSKDKALAILTEGKLDVLTGMKTRSFYLNTLFPDDSSAVTVDGHMVGVWLGHPVLMKSREASLNSKQYTAIAADIRSVAEWTKLPAPRVQATLWLTWKRLNGILVRQAGTEQQTAFDWGAEFIDF